MTDSVTTERRAHVLTVILNRPERRNALDVPSMRELRVVLQDAAMDPQARAVVLTGRGEAFSAGGDVTAMDEYRSRGELPQLFHALTAELELVIRDVVSMPKPVLASLPGVAAGGGLSLALASDWRIASERAMLVPAFSQLGAVPDGGLTYFLPHYLGIGTAQEMLFSRARIDASRARELGLVHEVVPHEELVSRTAERAAELADGPTATYGLTKRLVLSAFGASLETQLALERRAAVEAAQGTELSEGIRAFREKRSPRFG